MMFIARCSLFLIALQFIVIARYYTSLRLVRSKQQRTLNIIQLRFLGLWYECARLLNGQFIRKLSLI